MTQPSANSMNALTKLNALRKQARELGIEKPNTMKAADLEIAIAEVLATRSADKAKRDAEGDPFDEIDPTVEGDHLDETVQDKIIERRITREAWLNSAVEALAPLLKQAGAHVDPMRVAVSVGFPSQAVRKRIGECWPTASTNGGVSHMFISPTIDDTLKVLGTLTHELIHASDDCASKHGGHFASCAKAVGLTGKMTATTVGPELEVSLKEIAQELGDYPHVKLNLSGVKKQTTRMLKGVCGDPECPLTDEKGGRYTVRLTAKWINVGMPSCPCGAEMVADTDGDKE